MEKSKHKWTFSDFVTRAEELSNTPKRFNGVVFKTFLREFEFYSNAASEYGIEVLKNIFLPHGSFYEKPLPGGLLQALMGQEEPSIAGEDILMIRDDQIQQIVENIESRKKPPSTPILFEDVIEKLQSLCRGDLNKDDALHHLEFLHEFDCLAIQWAIRILTTSVQSKFKCSTAEMVTWFEDVQSNPMNRRSSIIGAPQDPMLLVKTSSNIKDYEEKILKFCGDSFLLETKYDGERFQVHKMRNQYRFYSRNKIDYTEKLGKDSSKQFASKIHPAFKEDVTHCILDCELLVWDRTYQKLVGKNEKASDGKIYDVKNLLESKDDDDRVVTRTLCVFDVLHLNGVDLIDWTLSARLKALEEMFNQDLLTEETFFLSKYTLTFKRQDFVKYYNDSMHQILEGIVVKSLYSTYAFGARSQANGWYKVKPDYGSSHTLDLAITAVRLDKQGRVLSFEIAALVSKGPLLFKYSGTIMAHMKNLDRNRLLSMLKGSNGFLGNRKPAWMQGPEGLDRHKSIAYVDLKNIVVVEVRASGLMRGVLRFPSIVCIRSDKNPIDANTIKDVEEYENDIRKIIDVDNEAPVRQAHKRKIQHSVPIELKRFHKSKADDARQIFVCKLKDSVSPSDLDELTNLGFSFVPNLTKNAVCVVTDEPDSFRVKTLKTKNVCHIVKGDWLKRCRDRGALVAWKEDDIIFNCENATFSLFPDSADVEVLENEDQEDDEPNTIEEALEDVLDADSDPEFLMDYEDDSEVNEEDGQ